MLRVASVNVNGIRAARRRGFGDWLAQRDCDVVTLQEVRCRVEDLPEDAFGGYHVAYDPGSIPGRNGVAVLTRSRPAAVRTWGAEVLLRGPGDRQTGLVAADAPGTLARGISRYAGEGRYVEVDVELADAAVTVASLYLPKGGLPAELQQPGRMRDEPDGGARYARKMHFLDAFARQLSRSRRAARARGREFLLTGDLNLAHTRLDVASWRRNQQSEGFLPQERAWLDAQLSPRTLVDVVRRLHPGVEGPYTWWSWLGQAYARDAGWRIDHQLATPGLARRAVSAVVDREHRGVRLSDHAPVVVDYARPLG
ncbi:exodeoxyribonuclease III [Serinicoccus sp. CNJ-927]|uniref:exodeoxyribonuclease III n=1 Tax=Serinicoccus sp. CNJ-927 TaxID=1904970 RepID=UPI00095A0BF5|nr:exodeoxyribonuclease III [Serinicoccus sp. CNJ-927]OLT39576.1 exodeoxyribonuclease III [Serinicoccus sp. CNJ-927]